jgi:hypothetical protein
MTEDRVVERTATRKQWWWRRLWHVAFVAAIATVLVVLTGSASRIFSIVLLTLFLDVAFEINVWRRARLHEHDL